MRQSIDKRIPRYGDLIVPTFNALQSMDGSGSNEEILNHLPLRRDLQTLYRVPADEPRVEELEGEIAHAVVLSESLLQRTDAYRRLIDDPVVAEVAEQHGLGARLDIGHIVADDDRPAEQVVDGSGPQIRAVVVRQLAESESGRIVHHPSRLFAVLGLYGEEEIDNVVVGKALRRDAGHKAREQGKSNCPLCAIGHDANRTKIWDLKDMDADHVKAWSAGGSTDERNCQMLCKTHNRAKGNR